MKIFIFLLVVFGCVGPVHAQYYNYNVVNYPAYPVFPRYYNTRQFVPQSYANKLRYLEQKEAYYKRASQVSLDHYENRLNNTERRYTLAERDANLKTQERSLVSKGILPEVPYHEYTFGFNGKKYRNYQEFVGTPEWQEMVDNSKKPEAILDKQVTADLTKIKQWRKGMGDTPRSDNLETVKRIMGADWWDKYGWR